MDPQITKIVLHYVIMMLKSQARQINELSSQILALNATARDLDRRFDIVWPEKAKEAEEQIVPIRQHILDLYDLMLQAVETGDFSNLPTQPPDWFPR